MKTERKCVMCGAPLDFKACETMNDTCSDECDEVFSLIPGEYQYYLFPNMRFIAGMPRRLFRITRIELVNGVQRIIKINPAKRLKKATTKGKRKR